MSANTHLDGVLIEWGERLFYPRNRSVKSQTPRLHSSQDRAAAIRTRIEATVRPAPQVMVKVTGGGRGMGAIAAHFRYITKNGRLAIEDDRGVVERGKDAVREIERQWQFSGARIERECHRREAFNIMLSMPRDTDPVAIQGAAREFAKIEFADHSYVMVLHDHQAHPHVHLSVKAESKQGRRLNPRKADLQRWRESFAERLRERGIDAEATRQATRGEVRNRDALWCLKANEEGRQQVRRQPSKAGKATRLSREASLAAWKQVAWALAQSDSKDDRVLARKVVDFVKAMPMLRREAAPTREVQRVPAQQEHPTRPRDRTLMRTRARPTSVSSPPDGLGGRPSKATCPSAVSVDARLAASRVRWRRGFARPGLGAPRKPPRSVHVRVARLAPAVQIGPAPCHGARTQMHRRRERPTGDQAVDRRSTQAVACITVGKRANRRTGSATRGAVWTRFFTRVNDGWVLGA